MNYRLFLAIDLPAAFAPRVVRLQQQLTSLVPHAHWQELSQIHLTLNFLGRVDTRDIAKVKDLITTVTRIVPPFELQISFLETLYQRHEESLIYLAPTGDLETLRETHKALSKLLAKISPQPTRFLPHFTLGRLKKIDPITIKSMLGKISDADFIPWEPFTVDKLVLYRSLVSHKGAVYQKVTEFQLSK